MSDHFKTRQAAAENMNKIPDHFGWYSAPHQTKPDRDPGADALCPHCGERVGPHNEQNPIQTVSLLGIGADKSYFYRVHKQCRLNATQDERARIDSAVIDLDVSIN